MLRAAYAGQPVPATGDQVIKQLMCEAAGRRREDQLPQRRWLDFARAAVRRTRPKPLPPGEHPTLGRWCLVPCRPPRDELVHGLTPALPRSAATKGSSARLGRNALPKLVGDLRRRGHDIRGNAAIGLLHAGQRTAGAVRQRPPHSLAPALPEVPGAVRDRAASPSTTARSCTPNSSDDLPSYSMVGARPWR